VTRLFGGRLLPLVAGLILAAVGATVADPLQDGSLAYQRKDYETALNIWQPIAEQGNPEAQKWLGRLYDSGLGVPKDPAKAAFWYRYAAEQGDTYAQSRLGQMYIMGSGTMTRDTSIGLMWLKKAADQGDVGVQNHLGNLYSDGMWGVPKDEARAAAW
jgi:TPR repeat protein